MANRHEDRIRDYLAENLDLLEPGLRFVDKEMVVQYPMGADGRIDILAQDICNNRVVIEIKRSDQASRASLHELHKYLAIFRIRQGLGESQVRAIVVSTVWHELRLPLAEFAQISSYCVEGYEINALEDGTITDASRVDLSPRWEGIRISRQQGAYLHEDSRSRDTFDHILGETAKDAGIVDFVILHCDHDGSNPAVIRPYASYFIFSSPFLCLSPAEQDVLKEKLDWDELLDDPEENFLCALNSNLDYGSISFEVGYPERLSTISHTWEICVEAREGRFSEVTSCLSDQEIVNMALAVEGGSFHYVYRTSSPRFKYSWAELRASVDKVLLNIDEWIKPLNRLLDEVQTDFSTATISVALYHSGNLLFSLYHAADTGTLEYFPYLVITIDDPPTGRVHVVRACLAWNGSHVGRSAQEIIERAFGDITNFFVRLIMYDTSRAESHIMEILKLKPQFIEWRGTSHGAEICYKIIDDGEKLTRVEISVEELLSNSIADFVESETALAADVKALLDENSVGLSKRNHTK